MYDSCQIRKLGVCWDMKIYVLLVIFSILFPSAIFAEISPVEYQRMQEQSDEHLIIQIDQIRAPLQLFSWNRSVTISAEILSVYRTAHNLTPGDHIEIRYTSYRARPKVAGPRPIPVLQKGESYHAFLSWSDEEQCYVPAARGYSFDPPIMYQ
jgi:hypothetical protein